MIKIINNKCKCYTIYISTIFQILKTFKTSIQNGVSLFIFYFLVDIGFQGKDPLTDFRGSGLLGLKHLWQFNIADSRAEKVFKVGTGQKTWYFFAATGINISGKVIEFIEEGKCDKYFYEQNEEINLYLLTQKLYNEFFYEFNELWIERGYTDFMKVNSTLEEFMMLKADNIFLKLIYNKKLF